jgi:hypothetical protein
VLALPSPAWQRRNHAGCRGEGAGAGRRGRIGISDIVAEDRLSAEDRAERGSYVGCMAGALARGEYEAWLAAAGFTGIEVTFAHEVADGVHGAIVRATKPVNADAVASTRSNGSLPVIQDSGCC